MNVISFTRLLSLCVGVLISAAVAQETCLMTDTSCQCSVSRPSGTCMRSQGDGTCLLGRCQEGYRCDCFGYELCGVSKCGKHIPYGDAIASETVPFTCTMTPSAGLCTTVVDFVDSVGGASNAEAEASSSNDEATQDEMDGTRQIEEIQSQKRIVNQMLKDVERLADDIPDGELEEIEADAAIVIEAVGEAAETVVGAIRDAKRANDCMRDSRRYKRVARRRERLCNEKKEILREENGRGERRNAEVVGKLTREIEDLTKDRKKAAKMCGKKAKEAREFKISCGKKKKEAEKIKEKARRAGSSCMQRSQKSLGRAGAQMFA